MRDELCGADPTKRAWEGHHGPAEEVRASVPEPATVLLMLTGLALMVGVSRKRILAVADL